MSLALLAATFVTYASTGWQIAFLWWIVLSLLVAVVAVFGRRR